VQGIVLNKPEVPFGLPLTEDQWLYYYCLIVMVLLYWAAANMLNSRSGRRHDGDPRLCHRRRHDGHRHCALQDRHLRHQRGLHRHRRRALGLGHRLRGARQLRIFLSIKFLIGLVVGGIGSLVGSVVGGIFYVLVDNSAQALSTFVKNDLGLQFDLSAYTVFGILLIVLMYLMPMGIVGGVYYLVQNLRGSVRGGQAQQQAAQKQPAAR
jgi:branched-chain amino acid transport system permease protein